MSEQQDTMHEALEAAFDDQDTDSPPEAVETVDVEPTEVVEPNEAVEAVEAVEVAVKGAVEVEAEPVASKAPQSWGVEAREEWAKLSPALQDQIAKREKEIGHSLTTTGEARHFQDEFNQTVQPFQNFIQAEGATPMQAVGNLLQTAATLQGGSQHQKAARVAELISHYGIDIRTLDSLLAGEQPEQSQNSEFGNMLQTAMAPVNQFMQQQQNFQQQQYQEAQQNTQNEIVAFDAAHEFVADVKMDMADLMEMAGRRGETMSLEQAYERAIAYRPDIQNVIAQRKAAGAAQTNNQSMQQKRRASTSMPSGDGAMGEPVKPTSMRQQLMDAMDGN